MPCLCIFLYCDDLRPISAILMFVNLMIMINFSYRLIFVMVTGRSFASSSSSSFKFFKEYSTILFFRLVT